MRTRQDSSIMARQQVEEEEDRRRKKSKDKKRKEEKKEKEGKEKMKEKEEKEKEEKRKEEKEGEPHMYRRGRKPKDKKKKRTRNQCNTGTSTGTGTSTVHKWDTYRKTIHRLTLTLSRDEHFCTTLSVQRSSDSIVLLGQLQHYGEKIRQSKLAILQVFGELEAENSSDTRYPSLAEPDDNGMVNLEVINCSKCNEKDTEDDDILFCDREGCNRAYHESCLDPPLQKDQINFEDPEETWFCWQCECLDDCLEMVNAVCDSDATTVEMLFPELKNDSNLEELNRNIDEDDEDESDEDYNSQCDDDDSDEQSITHSDSDSDSGNDDGGDSNNDSTNDEDDDDNNDSGEDGSGTESDSLDKHILSIDDDEVRYLMAEAGSEAIDTNTADHKRKLRKRNKNNASECLEMFMPEQVQLNQSVARIKKGFVDVGHVVEINHGQEGTGHDGEFCEHRWLVSFGKDVVSMSWDELRPCLLEYAQYEVDMQRMERAKQAKTAVLSAPHDECNPDNIVIGKRRTTKVDYAMLNEALFGGETSETLSFLDDSNDTEYKSQRKSTVKTRSPVTDFTTSAPTAKRDRKRCARKSLDSLHFINEIEDNKKNSRRLKSDSGEIISNKRKRTHKNNKDMNVNDTEEFQLAQDAINQSGVVKPQRKKKVARKALLGKY